MNFHGSQSDPRQLRPRRSPGRTTLLLRALGAILGGALLAQVVVALVTALAPMIALGAVLVLAIIVGLVLLAAHLL
jgi:predicted PurR-regulated permease PerM